MQKFTAIIEYSWHRMTVTGEAHTWIDFVKKARDFYTKDKPHISDWDVGVIPVDTHNPVEI